MHAQRQPMDVVKNASAQLPMQVGDGRPAAVPEEVHENLVQHADHIHDKLERTDAALQAEIKRAQVSSRVIEKLRQELRNTGKAQSSSDPAQCVQRISALEVELRHKDFELQNEDQHVPRNSASSASCPTTVEVSPCMFCPRMRQELCFASVHVGTGNKHTPHKPA